jgi:hypothetical protein
MIEGSVLKQGDVEIEIDLHSLIRTDELIKNLDPVLIKKLGEAYGVKIGYGHPSTALRVMVRSHVQNEWFVATRGEIPVAVKDQHNKREKQIEQAAAASGGEGNGSDTPKERAPRPLARVKMATLNEAKTQDLGKIRGQRQIVVKYLGQVGEGTAEDIAKAIEASGEAYPSKDTVLNSVKYHLKGLKDTGFIVEVPQAQAEA